MQANPLRALLVDDQPQHVELLKASLREVGCAVVAVASFSDDLVALIGAKDPDVIIVDMDAPGRDTLESLAFVQSRIPRPIVMFAQDGRIGRRLFHRLFQSRLKPGAARAWSWAYLGLSAIPTRRNDGQRTPVGMIWGSDRKPATGFPPILYRVRLQDLRES